MSEERHTIQPAPVEFEDMQRLFENRPDLELSESSKDRIERCRDYLTDKLNRSNQPYYGINTGFGSLCDVRISREELEELQNNLIRSHASGVGDVIPDKIVRWILYLKIRNLSLGHSGVRRVLVERLIDFYNEECYPVIYESGSLGASGDLAPLAHLSLPLTGKGLMRVEGTSRPSEEVLSEKGWEPLVLQSKEGLALLNGTQFSNAYALHVLLESWRYINQAVLTAAMSMEAFNVSFSPYHTLVQKVRPHVGQVKIASAIRECLNDSGLKERDKASVQDPYSFRCVPQVLGSCLDLWYYLEDAVLTEANSVTDNPLIFPEEDEILSGGNFHAQPLAMAMDSFALALCEIGSIAERRVYQLVSGKRGLPDFLVPDPGLHSGLMIAQYAAASLVSQNKQLATPAAVDTIDSCKGQEDHVSMSANSGLKLYRILNNTRRILAIECLVAIQAMEYRDYRAAPMLDRLIKKFRKSVDPLEKDRVIHEDITIAEDFLMQMDSDEWTVL